MSTAAPPDTTSRHTLLKEADVPINTVIPPVHPAAWDRAQIGMPQQFADINQGLIVRGLKVWSEENNYEVWRGVRKHFNSRLGNESSEAQRNFLRRLLLLVTAGILNFTALMQWGVRRKASCTASCVGEEPSAVLTPRCSKS